MFTGVKVFAASAALLSAGFLTAGCAAGGSGQADALTRQAAPAVSKACTREAATARAVLKQDGYKKPPTSPQALYAFIVKVIPHLTGAEQAQLEELAQALKARCRLH